MRARRVLAPADMVHATWDHYTAALDRDEAERTMLPDDAEIEAATKVAIEHIQREEIDMRDPLACKRCQRPTFLSLPDRLIGGA